MTVEVVGFDIGSGLPEPQDFRDHPEIWHGGQFAMSKDWEALDSFARDAGAKLIIGDLRQTLEDFSLGTSTLAFASVDVDLYQSTVPILDWLGTLGSNSLLPATCIYFDDVFTNWTYSNFSGEALSIREFNDAQATRKIELKDKGLKLFALHDFDHDFRSGKERPKVPQEISVSRLEGFYS